MVMVVGPFAASLLHPLVPSTANDEHVSASRSSTGCKACLRLRRAKPSGMKRNASSMPPTSFPKAGRSRAAVVIVEMVSVELCAMLFPLNVSVVGEKLHVAAVGRVPQAKLTLPV